MKWFLKLSSLFFVLAVYFILPCRVDADIYMYIDKDGVMHFTNMPMATDKETIEYQPYKNEHVRGYKRNYYSGGIDKLIAEASMKYDVSHHLLKAIIRVESNFDSRAISRKGAMGLMQIMPFNFKLLSIDDPFDPWENVMGGTRYFKLMLNKFNENIPLSLAAYNAGPNAVDKYGRIPPFPETQNYVQKVLKYYAQYKKYE